MTKPIRFGVQAIAPADPVAWPEVARKAEGLGYSILTMSDHFDNEMAPFPALAVAASATTTLRLGTAVLGNDFRHPAVLARDAATLDVLSGGRFELGIGAGWMHADYDPTGIPFDRAGVRIDRMTESVDIIRRLLAGETVTAHGDHYSVTDLALPSALVSDSAPPILMGGGGPRMLRAAARSADIVGINFNLAIGKIDASSGPDATLERSQEKLGWIREAAGERWADLEIQSRLHVATVTDDAVGLAEAFAPGFGLTPAEALATPHALFGTTDEIIEKIQRLHSELGISYYTWNVDVIDEMAPVVAAFA